MAGEESKMQVKLPGGINKRMKEWEGTWVSNKTNNPYEVTIEKYKRKRNKIYVGEME